MRRLRLDVSTGQPLVVLCLGAHSDDIEIGCGGTILHLLEHHPGSTVHWVVFSGRGEREAEAHNSAAAFLAEAAAADIVIHQFRDGFFPSVWAEIKQSFEDLKASVTPDLIFTHRLADAHQDHRTIGELTWTVFRDHFVAEYEIPKYEGDLGQPNLFVPLSAEVAQRKVDLLLEHFGSQRSRGWFRPETFLAIMALRGVECNATAGRAEGFYARKVLLA